MGQQTGVAMNEQSLRAAERGARELLVSLYPQGAGRQEKQEEQERKKCDALSDRRP